MAFNMKTWVDRITEYPTRRRLRKEDGSDELVTVSREEGQVSEEGDAFSAENMNDLESRIDSAFKDVNNSLGSINSNLAQQKELLSCTDVRKMNFGYYNGGYYIEFFFAEDNKYRIVATINDISLTYWNGTSWATLWKK